MALPAQEALQELTTQKRKLAVCASDDLPPLEGKLSPAARAEILLAIFRDAGDEQVLTTQERKLAVCLPASGCDDLFSSAEILIAVSSDTEGEA